MKDVRQLVVSVLKLFVFWVLLFDFQRILFSIHNWDKFNEVLWSDWFMTFIYSFRLDLATAAFLSVLPLTFLIIRFFHPAKWNLRMFQGVLLIEVLVAALVHAGEINAYPEWHHKLTSRVFMHLSNPDEVVRTADYSMTIWFAVYTILEMVFAWRIMKWFFAREWDKGDWNWYVKAPVGIAMYASFTGIFFLVARGGWQQIPINIDSAYFTNNHVANDLSVNSLYYFGNSYLLYNKSEIDEFLPKMDANRADSITAELFTYSRDHQNYVLKDKKPNVVFIIMESWAAEAIGCLSETKGATPNFDALAEEGILFTNLFATGSTSEIGNSSIFSGYPGLPEISISNQPEKHRKLHSLNEDFQDWGYSTHYIFSGDLKYGNIGGYFMDHGFQDVKDENDFPKDMPRGKLNYYDEDLYDILIERITNSKGKFLHCAFTGSTHPPYDYPKKGRQDWKGNEEDFMNSIIYADECLADFIKKAKKQKWFKNTLFVFVADHSHSTPSTPVPYTGEYYRIPLLLWGEPLKEEFRGKRIDKLGSQSDIAATLLYQMGGDPSRYPWSKDLLNPKAPEFALHTIIRGYGWRTSKGFFTYQMEQKQYIQNTYKPEDFEEEKEKGHAFLTSVYQAYKRL